MTADRDTPRERLIAWTLICLFVLVVLEALPIAAMVRYDASPLILLMMPAIAAFIWVVAWAGDTLLDDPGSSRREKVPAARCQQCERNFTETGKDA